MPMTATITINAHVRNVVAYDHMGGNHPLPGPAGDLEAGADVDVLLHSTYCCAHGAEGVLAIRGEAETAPGVWEAREDRFKLHQGETREWPL